jgi:hypothetical protein
VRLLSIVTLTLAASLIFGAAHAYAALSPFTSASGKVSLSVDALGTNDPAGGTIRVQKGAGATVRKAYLFAASTGFSGYTPANGDVTLNGTPVSWDPAHTIPNGISSFNAESDVTAIVKPIVDAAPAGIVNFLLSEGAKTSSYDGEVLAVILDDPAAPTGTVILMYGAQQTAGDTFNVALSDPVDKTNPNFGLDLSLGISYSYQPAGQYSTVDVNGHRMTSSAGGQDDGQPANGALITAGGIGDLNDNPPDPLATDTSCTGFFGPAPRCDDELYNLLPFVNNGDTTLTFNTQNPSANDNIFFAALNVKASAAIVGAGIVLGPAAATNPVNTNHTLTATVDDANGHPVQGVTVTFTVNSGPNAGLSGTGVTDVNGHATFTYSSSLTGTDTFTASFIDALGAKQTSNEATKTWVANNGDTTAPTCVLSGIVPGPPKQIQVTVQDTGSGLKSVVVDTSSNATTVVPLFVVGSTSAQIITSTKIDQTQGSSLALTVTDMAGNVTRCDPIVPGLGHRGSLSGVVTRRFANLLASEAKISILNGRPGLRSITVRVNGKLFTVKQLSAGQSRKINVASAMLPGHKNTITVRAKGLRASNATILITS